MAYNVISEFNRRIRVFAFSNQIPMEHFSLYDEVAHPVAISAARKFRIISKQFRTFTSDFNTVTNFMKRPLDKTGREMNGLFIFTAPAIWTKDHKSVMVFQNLPINLRTGNVTRTAGWNYNYNRYGGSEIGDSECALFPKISQTVADVIKSDLSGDVTKQKWTPTSRGIKRLGKREITTLGRFLSRFVRVDDREITDTDWFDVVAQRMLGLYEPPKFRFTETVEDMRLMYTRNSGETPSSCMDTGHNFSLPKGISPADFYHHCPITKGAFIERGGVVTARAILWELDSGWVYSRIYAVKEETKTLLRRHLEEHDVTAMENMSRPQIAGSVSFDMPSYIYGASRERYVPFPYFDTTPLKGIGVKLKEDGETVEVFMIGSCSREQADKLNHKYNRLRMDSTAGGHCIRASRYCLSCDSCLDGSGSEYRIDATSDAVCSHECATDIEASWYRIGPSGGYRYEVDIPRNSIAMYRQNGYFSNIHCAINVGSLVTPLISAELETCEVERDPFITSDLLNSSLDFKVRSTSRTEIRMYEKKAYNIPLVTTDCHSTHKHTYLKKGDDIQCVYLPRSQTPLLSINTSGKVDMINALNSQSSLSQWANMENRNNSVGLPILDMSNIEPISSADIEKLYFGDAQFSTTPSHWLVDNINYNRKEIK